MMYHFIPQVTGFQIILNIFEYYTLLRRRGLLLWFKACISLYQQLQKD